MEKKLIRRRRIKTATAGDYYKYYTLEQNAKGFIYKFYTCLKKDEIKMRTKP